MTLLLPAVMAFGVRPGLAAANPLDPSRPIDFSREVRPILANYCFPCHGPDDKARKANLRLDTEQGATTELPSGNRAIVPGRPGDCEALDELKSHDPDTVMPPAKLGKTPTPGTSRA